MKNLYYSPDTDEVIDDFIQGEGDEVMVKIGEEETEEAPEANPEEGEVVEDKVTKEETATEDEYVVPDEFKDKSTEDLIKMVQAGTSKIGTMGTELKTAKDQVKQSNLTPEELREALDSREVKILLDQEREKLRNMDPDEATRKELYDQQRLVDELIDEHGDKSRRENINEIIQSSDNKAFKAEQKEILKTEYELTDEEIANVEKVAENNYLENGKLTERSYHHTLVSVYGLDRVMKSASMKAEAKARTDTANAVSKTQAGVEATGKGSSGQYMNMDKLISDPQAYQKFLNGLTPEQHDKWEAQLEKKM